MPFKLLAAATAVLLGAAAIPSAITNLSRSQQQPGSSNRLPAEQPGALSAAAAPPAHTSSSSSSAAAGLRGRQFDRWMRQQLPAVLQRKLEELQRLQSMQAALCSMQASSSSSGVWQGAGREVAAVFGALGGCVREEIESLQIQVAALAASQQSPQQQGD